MGLGVLAFYAYRLATFKPRIPSIGASADEALKDAQLNDLFSFTDPNIIYQANGEGFHVEEEEWKDKSAKRTWSAGCFGNNPKSHQTR